MTNRKLEREIMECFYAFDSVIEKAKALEKESFNLLSDAIKSEDTQCSLQLRYKHLKKGISIIEHNLTSTIALCTNADMKSKHQFIMSDKLHKPFKTFRQK